MGVGLNGKKRKGLSLSAQILIGLILGVATGLFFGDKAGALAIIGRGYVGLLQMTILPYMVVSLIAGIGSLSYDKAGNLAVTGGLVLVGSWVLAFLIVFLMPLAFPSTEGGSFYSPSLVKAAEVDFIDLYIPVNPFSALARTVVPAAAVFSVAVGIALIGVDNKKNLLDVLDAISKTLTRVAMMVVRVAPFGIFAIAANAAGTMSLEEIGRLQTYILSFVVAVLILTFLVLPGLVAVLTPFTYRDVIRASRAALITGFVTGNLFIVLPMLIESAKELFAERNMASEDTDSYVEVLVPASFNFPNIGKLLTLLFILFAGWYTGKSIGIGEYPAFSTMGLFTLFGGVDLALPFLLDQMRIPSDLYQLYVVTGVVNGWFATLLAVMNLFAFTLVATCAATGAVQMNWLRLGRFAAVSVAVFGVAILGTRIGLSALVGDEDVARRTLMQSVVTNPVEAAVYKELPEDFEPADIGRSRRLAQILERGTLRVGYNPDNLPFSFFNDSGELVGFDVELMHGLARDLGVTLEFIPWTYSTLYNQMNRGEFDIAIGGLEFNLERRAYLAFSTPYMTITAGLVVPDHQRGEFTTWTDIDQNKIVRLGITGGSRARLAKAELPNTDIVRIDSYLPFFEDNPQGLDAIIISAEAGSAMTILYPEYAVAIPEPHFSTPMGLMMAKGDQDFISLVSDFLELKNVDPAIDQLYDKWILGKDKTQKKRRWSIGRDVLGWID